MKIIIVGAGEVGFHLAKLLSFESQDITLIDINRESLEYADGYLDIRIVRGDATSISVLKNAQVSETELVVGVTSSETINITVCLLAKQLGAKRTIAQIRNGELLDNESGIDFSRFGIDELIFPQAIAADEIKLLIDQIGFNDTYKFEEGALSMIGITLTLKDSFVNKTVKQIKQEYPNIESTPIAIKKQDIDKTLIPNDNTVFKEGDEAYFITTRKGVKEIHVLTGKKEKEIKSVMILGGSIIGCKVAKDLCESGFEVKLIEINKKKAFEIAESIPNCLVINGDGRNVELLDEEAIQEIDAFISVTGNSETNIISCLVARSKKVKKIISLVENMDYFQLSHAIGIDTLINKKLLAANAIFRYVRKGEVVAVTKLNDANAELLEFVVSANSKMCNKVIGEIKFPHSSVIGGVIRDNKGFVTLDGFQIKSGDRVVVCCLPESIKKIEKLFCMI